MSRDIVFAIPGDLESLTGGYGYDRRMMTELRTLGWSVRHLALPAGFPHPSPDERSETDRLFAALPDRACVLIDGLAFGPMPDLIAREAKRLNLAALIHHPLYLETGLSREVSQELFEAEKRALDHGRTIIVTSRTTGRTLETELGVAAEAITIAPPGTDRKARAEGGGTSPRILAVGSITPRKGHDILVAALAEIADLDWTCRIVGGVIDADHAGKLTEAIETHGLGERVTLAGAIGDLEPEYENADLFALATWYEGYGMVFAEALAHGLPLVGTSGGAVPDVVPEQAGILVEPGDVAGFSQALRRMVSDSGERRSYGNGAWDAAQHLPTWAQSAEAIDDALKRMIS